MLGTICINGKARGDTLDLKTLSSRGCRAGSGFPLQAIDMNAVNHLGNLGEDVVSLLFRRKIDDKFRFSVTFLGEKASLLDFMVNLLDDDGTAYGPYFFLQVKATEAITRPGRLIPARFSAGEVESARGRKAPSTWPAWNA